MYYEWIIYIPNLSCLLVRIYFVSEKNALYFLQLIYVLKRTAQENAIASYSPYASYSRLHKKNGKGQAQIEK